MGLVPCWGNGDSASSTRDLGGNFTQDCLPACLLQGSVCAPVMKVLMVRRRKWFLSQPCCDPPAESGLLFYVEPKCLALSWSCLSKDRGVSDTGGWMATSCAGMPPTLRKKWTLHQHLLGIPEASPHATIPVERQVLILVPSPYWGQGGGTELPWLT